MDVNDHRNGSARPAPSVKGGRHRIRPGVPLPGFPRVGGTRKEYAVGAILARNGRQIPGEDEAGAR